MNQPKVHSGVAWLAAVVAGLFPWVAVGFPKAMVILLVPVGIGGIIGAARRRDWRGLFPRYAGVLSGATLAWMLYKSLHTTGDESSLGLWLRLSALVLLGFGALWLYRALSGDDRRRVHNMLLCGMPLALASLWLVYLMHRYAHIDLMGGDHFDPLTALSRGQGIIAIMSALAWCVLLDRGHWWWAILLAAATFASFMPLSSNYAIVALVLALLGMLWGIAPRGPGLKFLAAILVAGVVSVPFIAATSIQGLADDPGFVAKLKRFDPEGRLVGSVRHRLQIWDFAADRALEGPWHGWGLDKSRRIPGGGTVTSLGDEVMPLHPHNVVLQVWLELGVPGLVLLVLIIAYASVAGASGRGPPLYVAARAATILPVLVIAGLAFGAWQNWWLSAIWLTAALVSTFPTERPENT